MSPFWLLLLCRCSRARWIARIQQRRTLTCARFVLRELPKFSLIARRMGRRDLGMQRLKLMRKEILPILLLRMVWLRMKAMELASLPLPVEP